MIYVIEMKTMISKKLQQS